jgi:hypothetical protein
MLPFATNFPLQHPKQDSAVILGSQLVPNPAVGIAQLEAGVILAEPLLPEEI